MQLCRLDPHVFSLLALQITVPMSIAMALQLLQLPQKGTNRLCSLYSQRSKDLLDWLGWLGWLGRLG
jgi:hypothetical protein